MPAKRRRWRLILLLSSLGALLGLIGAGLAAACRPAWYQPTGLDWSRLRDDKRAFAQMFDDISKTLNSRQAIDVELREDQVNRWIAARTEIPELWMDSAGRSFDPFLDPQVTFLPANRVRVAATLQWDRWRVIVSCIGRLELVPDELRVHWESVKLGSLPVPVSWITHRLQTTPQISQTTGGWAGNEIHLPVEGVWRNGKRPFRIIRLETDAGTIRLRLEPLPKQP